LAVRIAKKGQAKPDPFLQGDAALGVPKSIKNAESTFSLRNLSHFVIAGSDPQSGFSALSAKK
jgi:hypothetical protein